MQNLCAFKINSGLGGIGQHKCSLCEHILSFCGCYHVFFYPLGEITSKTVFKLNEFFFKLLETTKRNIDTKINK